MGGAVSVTADGGHSQSNDIDIESVKLIMGEAWSDEAATKLKSVTDNKTTSAELDTTEVKELLNWLKQQGHVSPEKLQELKNLLHQEGKYNNEKAKYYYTKQDFIQ